MSEHSNQREPYRIPKHIDAKITLFDMDVRGWIIVAVATVVAIIELLPVLLGHGVTVSSIMAHLFFAFLTIMIPGVLAKDKRIVNAFIQAIYHRKHAKIVRWESDPNAFIDDYIQKRH